MAPFYSYSSVPLFVNFADTKLPLNMAFSFLVSSPVISLKDLMLLVDVFKTGVTVICIMINLIVTMVNNAIVRGVRVRGCIRSFVHGTGDISIRSSTLAIESQLVFTGRRMVRAFGGIFPCVLININVNTVVRG